MKNMVDINVILDDSCSDPKIVIHTKERTGQVESIIEAIEKVSENEYPRIPAFKDDGMVLLSQRDIVRIHTEGRKVVLDTEKENYTVNRSLSAVEQDLNLDRFIRISQSEIINLYKVKRFEFSIAGTVGIEFENGIKTWAARSRVKAIKKALERNTKDRKKQ